ncbi:hypothetical protein GCM10009851_24200 [Herbiconiux moechotypicola]|uniref:Uncharacterized protein n=1 Tax=Herbiconiux moechotypicola TaxID=637393 RepID=A0ABP5QK99_9MICO
MCDLSEAAGPVVEAMGGQRHRERQRLGFEVAPRRLGQRDGMSDESARVGPGDAARSESRKRGREFADEMLAVIDESSGRSLRSAGGARDLGDETAARPLERRPGSTWCVDSRLEFGPSDGFGDVLGTGGLERRDLGIARRDHRDLTIEPRPDRLRSGLIGPIDIPHAAVGEPVAREIGATTARRGCECRLCAEGDGRVLHEYNSTPCHRHRDRLWCDG